MDTDRIFWVPFRSCWVGGWGGGGGVFALNFMKCVEVNGLGIFSAHIAHSLDTK